jgi:hypothetical protein
MAGDWEDVLPLVWLGLSYGAPAGGARDVKNGGAPDRSSGRRPAVQPRRAQPPPLVLGPTPPGAIRSSSSLTLSSSA